MKLEAFQGCGLFGKAFLVYNFFGFIAFRVLRPINKLTEIEKKAFEI